MNGNIKCHWRKNCELVFGEVRLSSVRINHNVNVSFCEQFLSIVGLAFYRVLWMFLGRSSTPRLLAQLERDLLLRCELKQMGVALHELISQVHVNVHVVLHAELSFDVRDEL